MYQHILVPVQNDLCSQVATKYAFDLSRWLGSRVTLLFVQTKPLDDDEPELKTSWLNELASTARVVPDIRMVVANDKSVANVILEASQAEKIDLIVMGTHGREGIERLRLGSVAQAVAASSSIPVQIIPVRLQMPHGFVSKWKEALKTL
jgi:nucleotide-binding universal stress UspA family protein